MFGVASRSGAWRTGVGCVALVACACGGEAPSSSSSSATPLATTARTVAGPVVLEDRSSLSAEVLDLIDEHVSRAREAPQDPERHGTLGLVYEANRLWAEARDCFANARRLAPDDPVWALHGALARTNAGDREGGLVEFRDGAARFAEHAPLQYRLGTALLERGDLDGARAAFERALVARAEAASVHAALGEVALEAGELEPALAHLERALELDADYRVAHYLRGRALRQAGRIEEAERALERGAGGTRRFLADRGTARLSEFQVDVGRTVRRATALLDGGQVREAAALLEESLVWNPEDPQLLVNLGVARLREARYDEALALLERAAELDPDQVMVHVNLAACHLDAGRPAEALAAANRAVELEPRFSQALFLRGRAYAYLGDLASSVSAFESAQRVAPENPAIAQALGFSLVGLDRLDEAVAQFERQVQLVPDHWGPRVDLVQAQLAAGRTDEARSTLAEVERLGAPADQIAMLRAAVEERQ